VAVVPMPSPAHRELTGSLARHVAAEGRLPLLDVLRLDGPVPDADAASGSKVQALLAALSIDRSCPVPAGPLLLVGATYRSGWSMTVAASLLREAGASAVLPLVLHQLP
jgi:ATP-dependent DNA helicase RecQ